MLSSSASAGPAYFANGVAGRKKDTSTAGSLDFLPSVSFDDLHASIESASTDFKLTQFPAPNGVGNILDSQKMPQQDRQGASREASAAKGSLPPAAPKQTRSGSILRRPSTSSRQPSTSSLASAWSGTVDAPTAASTNASRARRQSHYPPVSGTTVPKPARKSMVPGSISDTESIGRATHRRRTSLVAEGTGSDSARSSVDGSDSSRFLVANTRASKAKSVQPPPGITQAGTIAGFGAVTAAEANRLSLASRSPRVSSKTSTPSSTSKRASMMPGSSSHASGLGARTISPTDTRRMKRLSMMPQTQGINGIANMPLLPPLAQDNPALSRSPSFLPTKVSASSNFGRTTPDMTNKPTPNTLSNITQARTSLTTGQPRLPPSVSTPNMRLGQSKTNGMHGQSASTDGEDVPPVPAIPKAYESPKEAPVDAYFTEKKKSIMGSETTSLHSNGSSNSLLAQHEAAKVRRRPSARKSSFVPTRAGEHDFGGQAKKQLAPLTLPPLSLAPINIPSGLKSTAMGDVSSRPPRPPKTPSTPMTASKSTFFSESRYDDVIQLPSLRSSSTVHHGSRVNDTPDISSSDSSSFKEPEKSSMSPFLSSSLPKGGFEHEGLKRSKTGGDLATITVPIFDEQTFKKPPGPRPPALPTKAPKSPPPIPQTEEPSTPSSISSLRRRLSMSWKRSSSKSGNTGSVDSTKKDDKVPMPQPSQESMPPPRIPISSTTSNLPSLKPRSPVTVPQGPELSTSSRRRKSSASSLNNLITQSKNDGWVGSKDANDNNTLPATRPLAKGAKPKTSTTPLYRAASYTAELDKEDVAANDEMRKMGSRRKETEVAAKTLDALRKRATAKERVGPQEAIRIALLNIYERGEIIDYNDVYFCGTQSARKVVGNLQSDAPNFGYDDDRGDYAIVPGDHLSYRYEIVDVLGKGSFGQVVRCIDHKHGTLVAVKIIRNKKRFHQQALVEVNILQKLREWDPRDKHSMVNFTQSFYFRGHLCISTELLDMNLYEFIKAHSFRGFSLRIVRRFTKQILSSLILLKKRKVIHCDLKPENILLRHPLNSELKVIDFGSSCFENEKVYTYIQSRFYRSPEVILGMTYGLPIDMWSVGCILAELFTGVPIFPGENEQEQLACIMEIFGPPEKHLIEKSTRRKLFFDSMGKPRLTVSSKGRRRRPSSKTLQQALKCDDEAFLDFLSKCLRWDPERRLKPEDAVRHEFITGHKMPPPPSRTRDPSPVKRPAPLAFTRPLPEPPGSKAPSSMRGGPSPQKHSSMAIPSSRRVSGITAATTASINRRTSAGPGLTLSSSGLPRVAGRSASGRSDLAAAGASAAMSRRA